MLSEIISSEKESLILDHIGDSNLFGRCDDCDDDVDVTRFPKTSISSDSDWETREEVMIIESNTRLRGACKYTCRSERFVECVSDDAGILSDVGFTKKRKQRGKRTNVSTRAP